MADIPRRKPPQAGNRGRRPPASRPPKKGIPPKKGMPPKKGVPPSGNAHPSPKPGQRPPGEEIPSNELGEKTLIGEELEKQVPVVQAESRPQEAENATVKIISGGTVSNYRLKKDKIVTTVGTQREDCDIVVNDSAVSNKQLAIIYYEGSYVIADCGVHDLATFDGVSARQVICPVGSRCVVNMNITSLIFESDPSSGAKAGTGKPPKRFHLEVEEDGSDKLSGAFAIKLGERTLRSVGEPIIIGGHKDCDLILRGEGLRPFHAIVHWGVDGICITNLSTGEVSVNGQPVAKIQVLQNNDSIAISGTEMIVSTQGDVEGRVEAMFGGYNLDFNYIRFTAIPGSVCRSFMLPAVGGAIMVGRSPHADVTLDDGAVSREHAQIIPNGKSCQLIDNYSANGCYVNNEKVTKARLRAGDLVEIGRSIFFMHYD